MRTEEKMEKTQLDPLELSDCKHERTDYATKKMTQSITLSWRVRYAIHPILHPLEQDCTSLRSRSLEMARTSVHFQGMACNFIVTFILLSVSGNRIWYQMLFRWHRNATLVLLIIVQPCSSTTSSCPVLFCPSSDFYGCSLSVWGILF